MRRQVSNSFIQAIAKARFNPADARKIAWVTLGDKRLLWQRIDGRGTPGLYFDLGNTFYESLEVPAVMREQWGRRAAIVLDR